MLKPNGKISGGCSQENGRVCAYLVCTRFNSQHKDSKIQKNLQLKRDCGGSSCTSVMCAQALGSSPSTEGIKAGLRASVSEMSDQDCDRVTLCLTAYTKVIL